MLSQVAEAALIYGCFAASVLLLVVTGILPRTRWNSDASFNNLLSVKMMPAEYYASAGQSMRGVHAQERVECFLRWVMVLSIVGIPFRASDWFFRQSELIGHAAEIVCAKGFNRDEYLHAEAARTYRSAAYRGIFDDLDLEQMKRALKRRFLVARVLALINAIAIGKVRRVP